MTVTSLLTEVTAEGNDSATSFSFSPVVIFAATDLIVTHVDADEVETVLSQGSGATDYSVTVPRFPGTGSITYPADEVTPLPTGESLVIRRVLPLTQATNLTNQGPYLPKVQENQFDRLVMIAQQLQAAIDLCVELPVLGTVGLAGAVPRVNAGETAIEWKTGLIGETGPAGPAGSPGSIVQHVHTVDTTTRTNATAATTTFETLTTTVSITPTSASNRVRIRVTGTVSVDGSASGVAYLTLFRDDTTDLTPAGDVEAMLVAVPASTSIIIPFCLEFVDSPATTSEVSYTLYGKTNGVAGVNVTVGGRNGSTALDSITTMIAEEILADGVSS